MTNQGNGRPLGAVVSEIKQEITDFARTRYQMLVSEMQQKLNAWKTAIPFLGAAMFLAFMAMILLSLALVAVIAVAIGWGWALFTVGAFYLIVAAIAGGIGYSELSRNSLAPERTLRVLKEDQVWLQKEAKTA